MKDFNNEQKAAIFDLFMACKKLQAVGVNVVYWNDRTVDFVNFKEYDWEIVEGSNSDYPHDDFKNIKLPAFWGAYVEDGMGIKLFEKA